MYDYVVKILSNQCRLPLRRFPDLFIKFNSFAATILILTAALKEAIKGADPNRYYFQNCFHGI